MVAATAAGKINVPRAFRLLCHSSWNGLVTFLSGIMYKSRAESWLLHFPCSGQSPNPNRTPSVTARCVAALSDLHFLSIASCFLVSVKSLSAWHNF